MTKEEKKLEKYIDFKSKNFWNRTKKMQENLENALNQIW